ncbi:MAG TPA: molybdopterin-synthase adenylyltransferase MoeB [Bacteroidia bacterium]|jgi:molybdopterin/thiamine biosynthesis adenylyltransferase/rhodanese-related sulfurtransferase|nr:molybdopterin-synthase adenylyltransferase MoeB [Bacteroidia bacterium]
MTNEELKRYARHIILSEIGLEGQQKLKQAKVLVIGAGGLGCPVLQYLTAAGVGTIGIVDFDKIDDSNLQRQILYSTEDVGKPKAQIAKEKLGKQNPYINLIAHVTQLTSTNALEIISLYDIVVDGSDNFATRYLVNDACVILNKILVFGSIFKFDGQVSVFNYKDGSTYRCLYPEPPAEGEVPNCAEIGVIGVLPGIIGTLQANEVIKIIVGVGEVLSGKLLVFNALTMQFDTFGISVNSANKKIDKLIDYDIFCGSTLEISADELKEKIKLKQDFQLLDVRELQEYEIKNIGGKLIPLNELATNLDKLSKEKEIVVHCASGVRSKKAISILKASGFTKVYNLKNGLLDF